MFRAGIIALLVLLVAGCGPSKTRKAFNSSQDSARQAEASGIITESEKYRRFLAAFNALPARDKRGQGHNAAYYEQMMDIAKAYEGKQISTAQYLELKQQADTYKSTRDAEYLRAARARSDAFGKSLNEAVKSLNQQPQYVPAPAYAPPPTPRTLTCTKDYTPYSPASVTCR
jgi:hypothetical protein